MNLGEIEIFRHSVLSLGPPNSSPSLMKNAFIPSHSTPSYVLPKYSSGIGIGQTFPKGETEKKDGVMDPK